MRFQYDMLSKRFRASGRYTMHRPLAVSERVYTSSRWCLPSRLPKPRPIGALPGAGIRAVSHRGVQASTVINLGLITVRTYHSTYFNIRHLL